MLKLTRMGKRSKAASQRRVLDWFSKVRAAKGRFNLWISCRFAEIVFSVPVCERRFLRCSSVVDVPNSCPRHSLLKNRHHSTEQRNSNHAHHDLPDGQTHPFLCPIFQKPSSILIWENNIPRHHLAFISDQIMLLCSFLKQ